MPAVRPALVALAFLLAGLTPALAFHDGGVAACAGCHTMHASQDGEPAPGWTPGGNPGLLKYGNATDTCLRCHAARGQLAGGSGHGPGGDFHWLARTFTWITASGAAVASPGHTHGHSVVSPAYGLAPDAVLATAPGGTFLAGRLGCTSCHDPHGTADFRMLYGAGRGPAYGDGERFAFAAPAPRARGNAGTTVPGGGGEETDRRHTVYGGGLSAWCANCHPALHDDAGARFTHPTGVPLGAVIAANYNRYVSTMDPAGGDATSAYAGLVPFESLDLDLGSVDPANRTAGPAATDQVMCLSCHRAHASPFADAGRWDFAATRLDRDTHPRAGDGGATAADIANRYYAYVIAAGQRSLCNKCHARDGDDGPPGDDRHPPAPGRRGPYPHDAVGP